MHCVERDAVALLPNTMARTTDERPATPETLLAAIGRYYPSRATHIAGSGNRGRRSGMKKPIHGRSLQHRISP
jgi:hypothetical protein